MAFGPERTLEQDPMFAFRIIVDIALKALSPAINDPTTAVVALDQVHRLLRLVGQRKLRGEVILDDSGQPRVIFRTPNWEHYVQIACSEIRACGANNLQVARRMRAMLENLRRHAAGAPARGAGIGTRPAGLGDPDALHPPRGTRTGPDSRHAGTGRIVRRAPPLNRGSELRLEVRLSARPEHRETRRGIGGQVGGRAETVRSSSSPAAPTSKSYGLGTRRT